MKRQIQLTFYYRYSEFGAPLFSLFGDKMTHKWCSIVVHMAAHSRKIWRTSTPFTVFFFTGKWNFLTVSISSVFMSSLLCCCESKGSFKCRRGFKNLVQLCTIRNSWLVKIKKVRLQNQKLRKLMVSDPIKMRVGASFFVLWSIHPRSYYDRVKKNKNKKTKNETKQNCSTSNKSTFGI